MTNKKKKTENHEDKEQDETTSISQKWLYTWSGFMVIVGVFSGLYMSVQTSSEIFRDQRATFNQFDTNNDGVITNEEFKTIFALLRKITSGNKDEHNDNKQTISQKSGQTITLKTKFTPLDLKSFETEEEYGNKLLEQPENLEGLVQWRKAFKTTLNIPTSDCRYFLPPDNAHVGSVWGLYHASDYELSNNRHYPEETEGVEQFLTTLLQGFHPRPFTVTRFGPKGGYAALRAKAGDIMDIYFRFHAEFQLNEPPTPPFWFTPGQFTGNIIINSRTQEIYDFNLYVPHDRTLNVDMEWINKDLDEESLNVHIGHMPNMELYMDKKPDVVIEWNKEISETEVKSSLEKAFYPFKKVDYYKFEEAFDRAALENKLVHSILLWGALDDQSC